MSMTKYGLMGLTPKGKQLLNKVQSGQGNIKITKLKAGAGIYEEGEDYTQREDLKDPRQEFEITSKTVESDDSVLLVVKLTNYIDEEEYLETGYKIREMAFYADDPDDGEICYSIMAGTDDTMMDYMPAYDGLIPSVITNYYQVQVANAGQVEIVLASTESVYSEEGANGLRIYQSKMQYLDGGEWKDLDVDASNMSVDIDESSTVEGITDFPSFLATLVGKLSIFNTIRNFKAGLQFVLHMGQLVSNTSTNNANLPASAAAVYQNAQEIAALNTEIQGLSNLKINKVPNGDLNNCYNIAGFSLHVFTSSDNHIPFSATGYVMTFNYDFNSRMQIAFELMTKTATLHKRENTLDWDAYN